MARGSSGMLDQNSPKLVAIYTRVSTAEQARGEYDSIKAQEELVRRDLERKGWQIYKVYSDTKTGANIDRPGLKGLLDDASKGEFNVLACTKLDRISRSVKDFMNLFERLRELDVYPYIVTQNWDFTDTSPMGNLLRTMLISFAQFERGMTAERTREKLTMQASNGLWTGGIVPLGYDSKDKRLVVNAIEKKAVKMIFDLYLKTPSTSKVGADLNARGYRTKTRKSKSGTITGGNKFTKKVVHDILVNPVYKGVVRFDGVEYHGKHEPLVSNETFDRVQAQLSRSGKELHRTHITKSGLVLLGTLKCGFCNSFMSETSTTERTTGKKYYYYKCSKANHSTKEFCDSMDLPATAIEEFAHGMVKKFVSEPSFLDICIKQMGVNSDSEIKSLDMQKAELEKNLVQIQRKLDNLTTRFTDDPGLMNSTTLKGKLKELEESESSIEEKLNELGSEIERKKARSFDRKSFEYLMKSFDRVYPQLPVATRQQANRLVFKEIKSHVRRGSKEGILEIKMRGDGKTVERWEELIKRNSPNSGESAGSSHRTLSLLGQDSNLQPIG